MVLASCLDIDRTVLTYLTLTNGLTDIPHLWSFAVFPLFCALSAYWNSWQLRCRFPLHPYVVTFGKFHARQGEIYRIVFLACDRGYLGQGGRHPGVRLGAEKVLHAT